MINVEAKSTFQVLKEHAKRIGYGEMPVTLIVYNGRITGFDLIEPTKIKYRENQTKKH